MSQAPTRTAAINLRALHSQRDLIDKAATLSGRSRSDFMLEIACREAENILLDQNLFRLDDNSFDKFMTAFESPVKDNPALLKLLSSKTPWE